MIQKDHFKLRFRDWLEIQFNLGSFPDLQVGVLCTFLIFMMQFPTIT